MRARTPKNPAGSRALTAAIGVFVFVFCVARVGANQDPSRFESHFAHLSEVQAIFEEADGRNAERSLEELGSDAAAAVWALLSGRGRPDDLDLDSTACRNLARRAFASWDGNEVVTQLVAAPGERPTLAERLVLIECLSWTDSSDALEAIFAETSKIDGVQLQSRRVSSSFERALGNLLEDRPHRFRHLSAHLEGLPRPLIAALIGYAFEDSSYEAGRLLSRALTTNDHAESIVLENLARGQGPAMLWTNSDCIDLARRALNDRDLLTRRLAVAALGNLRDSESFEGIVDMLSAPEKSVERSAQTALAKMTGLRRTWTPGQWTDWFDKERARFHKTREAAYAMATATPGECAAVIRDLSQYHLFARESIAPLANALDHSSPDIRVLACEALARTVTPARFPFSRDSSTTPRRACEARPPLASKPAAA